MKTKALASSSSLSSEVYLGIDYHKRYSVYCALDAQGQEVGRGRIDHRCAEDFARLLGRWPRCAVVFEATMNWHWLYEILEAAAPGARLTLANPHKTRIIAEAQVKTDKLDAFNLAWLLRGGLICPVHIPSKETRERKEVLRQRCFFVRQRTRLRNRIHRLLGAQHGVQLPQCSDLFGKKGLGFLEKLTLPSPAGLLLKQQLDVLRTLQLRIKEDEAALEAMFAGSVAQARLLSLPGMGPILAAVAASEIDDISRFESAQKLCGYCGLCPRTKSSGGKTFHGKLLPWCNKWLRWAFIEAAWVAVHCSPYFGALYQARRARGKKPNTAIVSVARRMARIAWQVLTQDRDYESMPPAPHARAHQPKNNQLSPAAPIEYWLAALP